MTLGGLSEKSSFPDLTTNSPKKGFLNAVLILLRSNFPEEFFVGLGGEFQSNSKVIHTKIKVEVHGKIHQKCQSLNDTHLPRW